MTEVVAKQTRRKRPSEVRNVMVDARNKLDVGETLTGTVTLTVSPADQLTATSGAVSTQVLTIDQQKVEAGKAFTFTVAAGTAGTSYTVVASIGSSGSQTIEFPLVIEVTNT